MIPDKLIEDKNFVANVLKSVPYNISKNFSTDEMKSTLYLVLRACVGKFDPEKGKLRNYVSTALRNALTTEINQRVRIKSREAPLEAAMSIGYTVDYEDYALKEYIKSLPPKFVKDLTSFILGKSKKEDLFKSSYGGLTDSILERILDRIGPQV